MPPTGGVARRATRIAAERSANAHTLVLDAGNSLVGDRPPASSTFGQSSVEAMNRLHYDAMALGNTDLWLGAERLAERAGEAQFALLSADAVLTDSGKPVGQPFVVKQFGGHKVAIVGVSGRSNSQEIKIIDTIAAVREAVAEARKQAHTVILLSAAGDTVDRQIATGVPGIALIVSGGSPALDEPWLSSETGTYLVRADEGSPGHAGRIVGVAQLQLSGRGKVKSIAWTATALDPTIADDPALAAWVDTLVE